MAEPSDSSLAFFTKGTARQWAFIYNMRPAAIRVKADQRSSKKGGPEEFIKLDTWFREKVPALIKSRKEFHVLYDELVQIAKWRLMMGKYRPKMLDLVRINTESSVTGVTRKAFKKISAQKNLQQALTMLVNLKGIGPSTASAVLAAAFPEEAPFMSDEGMLSTPGVEATDSTIAEYVNYSDALRNKCQWLQQQDPEFHWTPHKVDQCLWIYYTVKEIKPLLLEPMPRDEEGAVSTSTSAPTSTAVEDADDNAQDCTSSNEETPTSMNGNYYHHPAEAGHHLHDSNSDSVSVPYSEEEYSQGGEASCSSSGALSGLTTSTSAHNNSNAIESVETVDLSIHNGHGYYTQTTETLEIVSTTTNTSGPNGIATNGNGDVATTQTTAVKRTVHELEFHDESISNGNGQEDSKDGCLLDSEDSHGGHENGQHLMTTPSEENSNSAPDCGLGLDVEDVDGPALKKQKTLELSSTAITAEAE